MLKVLVMQPHAQTAYEMGVSVFTYFLVIMLITSSLESMLKLNVIEQLAQKQAYLYGVETTIASKVAETRKGLSFSIDYGRYTVSNASAALLVNDTTGYNPAYVRWVRNNVTDAFTGRGIVNAWTISRT